MAALRRNAFAVIVIVFGSLLHCLDSFAQGVPLSMDISRPVPGVGHDYVKGLNETVNPANGSLNIKIELPVPTSRGISLPFSLTYNSGIVHHTMLQTYNGGTITALVMDGQHYEPTDRSINGWSDTIPYVAAASWSVDAPPQSNQQAYCDVTASYTLYDANGASHSLGITAISPIIGGNGGGTPVEQSPCTGNGAYNSTASWSANGFFGKIIGGPCDGINTSSACNGAAPPFTASDINGTVYSFPGGYVSVGYNGTELNPMIFPTMIEDRNGNIVNIESGYSQTPYVPIAKTVFDTAGRSMVSVGYQGTTNIPSSYTVGGLTYDLGYTTTSASYTPSSTQVAPFPTTQYMTCNANLLSAIRARLLSRQ
jgi:hypothetical protein